MSIKLDGILERLKDVAKTANGYQARCPAHDDTKPSLSISAGANGRVLMYCHSRQCSFQKILQALGLESKSSAHRNSWDKDSLGEIEAVYQYLDEVKSLLYEVVRYSPKAFRQRRPKPGGGWVWNLNGVRRVLYRLPEMMAADLSVRIFITEGEKDADNLRALGAIATTCPQGAGKWGKLSCDSVLSGRRIAILVDKDDAGRSHGRDVAQRLYGRAADVRVVDLPGDGKDVTNWIEAGGTLDGLLRLVEETPTYAPPTAASLSTSSDLRPCILVDAEAHRVANEMIAILAMDEDVYQRAGSLVRVIRRNRPHAHRVGCGVNAVIQVLTSDTLMDRLSLHARFARLNQAGEEIARLPPHWAISIVESRRYWSGIRELMAVSGVPVLRPDGSLMEAPGYDESTGVLFLPDYEGSLSIPVKISRDDAVRASEDLLELVGDFPFDCTISKSAFLAALLTPLARFAFDGPTPVFVFDANVRAAGKTKLVQLIAHIVLGTELGVCTYAHEGDELRKLLTSSARAGERMILFDNVVGDFGNATLDRALTSRMWMDRILGQSENIELPLSPCWYCTGNNISVRGDTIRRTIRCRLESPDEFPEARASFKLPDLMGHVDAHRADILVSAFTVLAAFLRTGERVRLRSFGSFEPWSRVVREAVVWAGHPDPCESTRTLAVSSDTDREEMIQFMSVWKEIDPNDEGVVMAELLHRLYPEDGRAALDDEVSNRMRAALEALVPVRRGEKPTARRVAKQLSLVRGTVIGGRKFDRNLKESGRNGAVWHLIECARSQ